MPNQEPEQCVGEERRKGPVELGGALPRQSRPVCLQVRRVPVRRVAGQVRARDHERRRDLPERRRHVAWWLLRPSW